MQSVEIYIKVNDEYKRIDLFKDETISVNSSIQNINDLSKVFTDFSQSFTIPASPNNNTIFNYWNNGSVNDGFDHRIRYDARIEINTIPFRIGKIQIEKANEKNNEVESFTITFYGNTRQIKDLFKEEELSVLDYSSLNHTYNYANVVGRVDGSILSDVRYPIVGATKRYEYLTGTANDITIGGTLNRSVVFSDLFPAIPVSKIFDFISNRYGINFTGFFLNSTYFTDLYLYCKNSESTITYTPPVLINWTSVSGTFPELNLTNDTYFVKWTLANNTTIVNYQRTEIVVAPTNPTIQYKVTVRIYDNPSYANGAIYTTFDNLIGTQVLLLVDWHNGDIYNVDGKFTFEVQSTTPMTFSSEIRNRKVKYGSGGTIENRIGYATSQSTSQVINIQSYIPKIKVIDFFTGIIKLFNLTIIPTNENTFELQPLDFFYAFGKYSDITEYVIIDNIDIERPKLFKKITFSHEKSDNILNNAFRNLFNRDYGDLDYQDLQSNESSSYEIKSPFEDILYEKTTGYDFVTATLIDKDQNPYKPKPILMYMNDGVVLPTPIKFFDGTNYNNVNTYRKFSNEMYLLGTNASLNFGEEQSVNFPGLLSSNSLYLLWYKNYIEQLYNLRTRIVKLKSKIPQTMLADIKMNDKIIYKDKKYTINSFTSDLTTGEVSFELITDFRAVWGQSGSTFARQENYNLSANAQTIEVSILKGNSEGFTLTYNGSTTGIQLDDANLKINVLSNTTGDIKLTQGEVNYFNNGAITSTRYINILQEA
jgi:hypothetical protein